MVYFVFFYNSIAAHVAPSLTCSTCLNFSLNVLSCSERGIIYIFSETISSIQKKKPWSNFFRKFVGLQLPDLLKRNPTMSAFFGITEMTFWCIFQNRFDMESLKMIDKSCSSSLIIFLNMAYIFIWSHKKWEDISTAFNFLLSWFSYALCLFKFYYAIF